MFGVAGIPTDVANAYAIVRADGVHPLFAYAAIVDNQSQDLVCHDRTRTDAVADRAGANATAVPRASRRRPTGLLKAGLLRRPWESRASPARGAPGPRRILRASSASPPRHTIAADLHDPFHPEHGSGPTRVLAPLGAGGMGEVYRARDAKLGRDIAVKVLPSATASDPDRRAALRAGGALGLRR